jgi:hypothetical protein
LQKGERGIWPRRFWEHVIRDELDYERHIDYIHYNPVKHGHVAKVVDWPYSSFHRFVRAVFITLNGGQMMTFGVWRWNEAKGGMRFAFPPYGLRALEKEKIGAIS